MTKLLFVFRHAPYGQALAWEALDALLASASYGQEVSVVFLDEGVFQLLPEQAPEALPQKSYGTRLGLLSLYELEPIYVHSDSCRERGIAMDSLVLDGLRPLNSEQLGQLLAEQDQILSF